MKFRNLSLSAAALAIGLLAAGGPVSAQTSPTGDSW